jgi:hypothetical protein
MFCGFCGPYFVESPGEEWLRMTSFNLVVNVVKDTFNGEMKGGYDTVNSTQRTP